MTIAVCIRYNPTIPPAEEVPARVEPQEAFWNDELHLELEETGLQYTFCRLDDRK